MEAKQEEQQQSDRQEQNSTNETMWSELAIERCERSLEGLSD